MTLRPPVKPGDSLVLLPMDCRPETPFPNIAAVPAVN